MQDGIYVAYLSGAAGNSFAMLVFRDGALVGADAGLGRYDGHYEVKDGKLVGVLKFGLPPNAQSITGIATSDQDFVIEFKLNLSLPLQAAEFHEVETPMGPVNARFELLREFND